MIPSQHSVQSQGQQNGISRTSQPSEPPAILYLLPMNGTFERKQITVPFYPDVLRIGRQTNQKTIPTPLNGYFDSKVLSRQHAEVWADRSGKIWIRDVKSSNGTFVNGQRLSQENRDSDPHELREQDVLELGIDIVSEDGKTVVHHKVAARVEHAGIYTNNANLLDLSFGELDPSNSGGFMPPSLNTGYGQMMRPRTGSQGSIGSNGRLGSAPASIAGNNFNAVGQQRHMNFWLTPVSMEQIVKRLNVSHQLCAIGTFTHIIQVELKRAKQQSQDLNRTGRCLETILAPKPKKDLSKAPQTQQHKLSPVKDTKTRFSEPPAPPPQQPLPEKPDAARGLPESILPLLRRNDTERPVLPSIVDLPSKSDASHHIVSLVEALTSAKQELDSQSTRLKDLEGMLAQERSARESAEERAQRLEMESRGDRKEPAPKPSSGSLASHSNAGHNNNSNDADGLAQSETSNEDDQKEVQTATRDESSKTLQQRLDMLLSEMNEMKQQMEKYRRRAETAEEESARDRRTLAEMVEKIRTDEAQLASTDATKPRRPSSYSHKTSPAEVGEASHNGSLVAHHGNDLRDKGVASLLRRVGVQNGRPISPEQVAELERAVSTALATSGRSDDPLAQSAPYASILGVVLLGVGLMAYLNGWQKTD